MATEPIGPPNEIQNFPVTSDSPERIGLALSGGGFRATLFHLGVVRCLFDNGLLPRVHFIGGVSGGSILAMHVGLHWDQYSGNESTFDAVAREVIAFCQRDVRNRIIRRWLFGISTIIPRFLFGWTRVHLLISEYARLFKNHTLNDLLPTVGSQKPRINVQSVSLTTGQPCSFGRSGFMWYEANEQGSLNEVENSILAPHLSIAFAVAASSAFPPLFPPVLITSKDLHVNASQFPYPQYVTDGGVYDNLGIERPLFYFEQEDELDAFILSDAGGTFDRSHYSYKFALPRNLRAVDILMKRVGDLVYQRLLDKQKQHDFAYVRITDTSDSRTPGTLPPAVQRRVCGVRTDLDAFTDIEISTLVQHGYGVARGQLIEKGWINANARNCEWIVVPVKSMETNPWAILLRKSSRRRFLPLFSLRDWPIWVVMAVLLFGIGSAAYFLSMI